MNFLKEFYRTQPDGAFKAYSPMHLAFILFVASLVILASRLNKDEIGKLKKVLASLLIFDMVNRYGFYIFTGYSGLKESLPLYHCRIVAILSLIYLFRPSNALGTIIFYWGLMGGILALLHPIPDPFAFPHILLVLFFLYHSVLFMMAVVVAKDGNNKLPLSTIRRITLCFNIFLIIVNFFLKSDYGFLTSPPIASELLLNNLGSVGYKVLALIVYDLIMVVIYKVKYIFIHLLSKDDEMSNPTLK